MQALVALGSNLGDRAGILRDALSALGRLEGARLLRASALHETPPERPGDGGLFLNAAALLATRLPPAQLLDRLHTIERRHGRRRPTPRGPRTLDLDLILLGAQQSAGHGVELPHPRFRERAFVLGPAVEVAPRLRDPVSGRTLRELHEALRRGA